MSPALFEVDAWAQCRGGGTWHQVEARGGAAGGRVNVYFPCMGRWKLMDGQRVMDYRWRPAVGESRCQNAVCQQEMGA